MLSKFIKIKWQEKLKLHFLIHAQNKRNGKNCIWDYRIFMLLLEKEKDMELLDGI